MNLKLFKILASLLWIYLLQACVASTPIGGGNPAGPPAGLAEIPSLQFPEGLSNEFNVETPASSGSDVAQLKAMLKAMVMPGDNISDEISRSAENYQNYSQLVDQILEPLHQMLIPRRVDLIHFEDLIIIGDELVNVKIDFTPYEGETCSGNTAELPVCYRIWFNDKRALIGVFLKAFPTPENPGAGRFRGISPTKYLGLVPFAANVSYDVVDPSNKEAEYYVGIPKGPDNPEDPFPFEDVPKDKSELLLTAHLLINQMGLDFSALKIIFGSIENFIFNFEVQDIGRWREDDNFWSGSVETTEPNEPDFQAACALLSSGIVVDQQECIDRSIDVEGLNFIPFVEISDLAFPPDFPPSPTF